jgi:hypothetical protein
VGRICFVEFTDVSASLKVVVDSDILIEREGLEG